MNPTRRRRRTLAFRPQVDGLESRWLLVAGLHSPPTVVGPVSPGPAAAGGGAAHHSAPPGAAASATGSSSTPRSDAPILAHAEAIPVGAAGSPGSSTISATSPGASGHRAHHAPHHHSHPKRPRRHRHGGGGGGGDSGSDLNVDPSENEATPAEQGTFRAHAGTTHPNHSKAGKIHQASHATHPAPHRGWHEATQHHATGHRVATAHPAGSTVAARGVTVRIVQAASAHPQVHSGSAHGDDSDDLSDFDNTAGPKAKRMHEPHAFHLGVSHRMGGGGGGDQDDSDNDRDNRDDAPGREADEDSPQSTIGMDSHQIGAATPAHKAEEGKAVPQAILDNPGDGPAPLARPSGGATPTATAAEGPASPGPRPSPRGEAAPDESE